MNGNNKSTASRLWYCIHLVGRVLFPSKTRAVSTKETSSSAHTNPQLAWLKNEYQKEYRILRRKARIHPEKAIVGGLFVGFLLGLGAMKSIHQKSK